MRAKIYQTVYWKESCFGLNAETIVDKAVELRAVGGTYGGVRKPTEFLCLILKMLQIQPDKDIIIEFIKNEEFKYVRLLGEWPDTQDAGPCCCRQHQYTRTQCICSCSSYLAGALPLLQLQQADHVELVSVQARQHALPCLLPQLQTRRSSP